MRKMPFLWIAIATIAIVVTVFIFFVSSHPKSLRTVDLSYFHIERVTTDTDRALGLGGRTSLADDAGMLFLFEKTGIYPFWMKGMHFPLDIIWINGDRVVDVATLPPPATEDVVPASHIPIRFADTVLEIHAGLAKKMGIQAGSRLLLPKD